MKKLFALSVVALFLFSGCGAKVAQDDTENTKSTSAETSSTAIEANKDLSEYVTLANYKDISVDWTEGEANELYTDALSDETPQSEKVTDRAVKKGDIANIDYTGYYKGEAFSGGSAEGYDLTIGSGSFIDGFEDGLIGVKVGETKDLNLTFPENYSGDMAGKSVVFKVKVNYITTYSDEQIKNAKQSVFGSVLLSDVISNSNFADNLPKDGIKRYNEWYKDYYTNYAKSNGYTDLDEFLTKNNTTSSEFSSILEKTSQQQMTIEIAVNAIAEKENITVSTSEYNSAVNSYAANNSLTVSEFLQSATEENVKLSLLQDKVEEFLAKNSTLE